MLEARILGSYFLLPVPHLLETNLGWLTVRPAGVDNGMDGKGTDFDIYTIPFLGLACRIGNRRYAENLSNGWFLYLYTCLTLKTLTFYPYERKTSSAWSSLC